MGKWMDVEGDTAIWVIDYQVFVTMSAVSIWVVFRHLKVMNRIYW